MATHCAAAQALEEELVDEIRQQPGIQRDDGPGRAQPDLGRLPALRHGEDRQRLLDERIVGRQGRRPGEGRQRRRQMLRPCLADRAGPAPTRRAPGRRGASARTGRRGWQSGNPRPRPVASGRAACSPLLPGRQDPPVGRRPGVPDLERGLMPQPPADRQGALVARIQRERGLRPLGSRCARSTPGRVAVGEPGGHQRGPYDPHHERRGTGRPPSRPA